VFAGALRRGAAVAVEKSVIIRVTLAFASAVVARALARRRSRVTSPTASRPPPSPSSRTRC
jgi:hypothetical protein